MSVNLSIKDVPEAVAERLRLRAGRNHRSLQGELMAIIESAAGNEAAAAPDRWAVAPGARARQQGWKTVEDLMAERRAHPLVTTPGLPLAVDIIRADRDER
jgi:plasmid stability protein